MESNSIIQLFQTESSEIAPFFLILRREAAVKYMLLSTESPKTLGTDEGVINVELMKKLHYVVTHNLNKATVARDGNKTKRNQPQPDNLEIGDNVLVRDYTSKVFKPKYKNFCIVKFLGKNKIEVKDNHGHISKVHHKDIKKISM